MSQWIFIKPRVLKKERGEGGGWKLRIGRSDELLYFTKAGSMARAGRKVSQKVRDDEER